MKKDLQHPLEALTSVSLFDADIKNTSWTLPEGLVAASERT